MRNFKAINIALVLLPALVGGPAFARLVSVDPVKPNTKSGDNFNRYHYANNNPYKYTDPDGRRIKLAGTPEERKKAADAVDKVMAKPEGAKVVQGLQASDHSFTIKPTTGGNLSGIQRVDLQKAQTEGVGSDGFILFNPDSTSGPRDSSGSTERPAFVGLAHEFGHLKLINEGRYSIDYGNQENRTTPPAEIEPLKIENDVRRENGLPQRTWYYDYEE